MQNSLDAIDQSILAKAIESRDSLKESRIGDFVLFSDGQLERLSHDWGSDMQTSPGGSFSLSANGHGSLSCGGLHPAIPKSSLELTKASLPGGFWFFHHGIPGAGRGVGFDISCRVYKTNAPYKGYLGKDLQSARSEELKRQLAAQLQPEM